MAKFYIDISEVYKATYTIEAESYEEVWEALKNPTEVLQFKDHTWESWLHNSIVYIENVEEQGARTYVIGKD